MRSAEAGDVLRARARVLAKPRIEAGDGIAVDGIDALVVVVEQQRFAIPLERIAAIARASTIVPLPRAVAPVYGVIAWRGRTLTVLTLAGVAPELRDDSRFVVLGDARRVELAILVDAVEDAVRIPFTSITRTDGSSRHAQASGVTNDAMLVLDVDALIRGRRNETTATPMA
ncbi:MAG: CheW domain-containing protein [bacterium]